MKPFNLEEAKAGKPVCTRDGKHVKILDWNYCYKSINEVRFCVIVANISGISHERIGFYNTDGSRFVPTDETLSEFKPASNSQYDLMMCTGKKYINLYYRKIANTSARFDTAEEAVAFGKECNDYMGTIAVEWEE